jgi:(1->4)-alpha-D-glucan 1-alpha-D-glucosylmutase
VKTPLRATYRVQLGPGMGFLELAGLADYLADLGVSHVYLSPVLQAAAGSTHGYDVVDPGRVSTELGGELGFTKAREALAARGLGLVLDVVPNHMSIAGTSNQWWWDVLENGPASHYAAHFDVDWSPGASVKENRIVLPILGERYAEAVEQGKIRLVREGGNFTVRYGEHVLPLAPRSLDWILRQAAGACGSDELLFLADAAQALPRTTETERRRVSKRHRDKAVIGLFLARLFERQSTCAAAVDATLAEIAGDPDRLDATLERQNFRLAYWRTAASQLGYRRFFDIHTLIGLRIEDPLVLEDTHRLIFGWLARGEIDGVRVDHPDGLRDPEGYLSSVRSVAPDAWIVAEKILAPGERLPETWPIDGTTGYDFLALVDGLLRDPEGVAPLDALATRFGGAPEDVVEQAKAAKREVLRDALGSELSRLVAEWHHLGEIDRRGRDSTWKELAEVLSETLVHFDVYRTYLRPGAPASPADVARVESAIAAARAARTDLDAWLFDWLTSILLRREGGARAQELAMRFQQVSGALMAKGVEDTTFYRHLRLIAANEVGGAPGFFAVTPEEFHRAMAAPGRTRTMLGTATHDTKRGEDVRARLAVLSELPLEWAEAVARWNARAERHRQGGAPDDADAYFFWQTLVGAWPLEPERAIQAMEKSVREARRQTSWSRPNEAYEAALRGYIEGVLGDADLRAEVAAFVARIEPATRANALARTLIKLTAPGIPDLYQGTELWDLSLVDPDNRRPVDWKRRRHLLAELRDAAPEAALARAGEGVAKLWLVAKVLRLRAADPALFEGAYVPLAASGARAQNLVAFARGDGLVTIVPRLVAKLDGGSSPASWGDTHVPLPPGRWRDHLTGVPVDGAASAAFARFPVALLTRAS